MNITQAETIFEPSAESLYANSVRSTTAHAVVKEAGGIVRTANGNDLIYNKEDLHNPEFFVYAASDSRLQAISGTTNHA